MIRWRIALLSATACLAWTGCGGSNDTEGPLAVGTPRQALLDDPCQWLSEDEVLGSLQRLNKPVEPEGVVALPNPTNLEVGSDCWYLPRPKAVEGQVTVTLIDSAEAAANWRTRISEATQVVRVADSPAIELSSTTAGAPVSCDVHALISDTAVAGVSVAGGARAEGTDPCTEARGLLATVIEGLPAAS